MELDNYQKFTNETAFYPDSSAEVVRVAQTTTGKILENWINLAYAAGKLNGEAGEIAEEVFKAMRDDKCEITEKRRLELQGEIGDCLYYIARVTQELGLSLDNIASYNMQKLRSRKERGVLQGSGSDR